MPLLLVSLPVGLVLLVLTLALSLQYTQEDLDVWDFSLTDAEMATLNALNKP